MKQFKIVSYDEQFDVFICECNNQDYQFQANCISLLTGISDEPHAFIGVVFTVTVN